MPFGQLTKKAGRISFLLVCLFLCTACGEEKTVFVAGEPAKISENTEVTIPEQESGGQESAEMPEKEASAGTTMLVNINTADAAELTTLPGIGETRAAAIIEYRTTVGKFEKNEDLMNVKGIKEGVYGKISSLICVK